VSRSDGTIDLEMAEHPLDAVALTVEALAVADRRLAVGFRRDNRSDPNRVRHPTAIPMWYVSAVALEHGRRQWLTTGAI
jgi:hypothetical protein